MKSELFYLSDMQCSVIMPFQVVVINLSLLLILIQDASSSVLHPSDKEYYKDTASREGEIERKFKDNDMLIIRSPRSGPTQTG